MGTVVVPCMRVKHDNKKRRGSEKLSMEKAIVERKLLRRINSVLLSMTNNGCRTRTNEEVYP